ncbi:GNAT family N-acetyltransferase [Nocardiopsis sp. CNT-189]|uniref:GNAT family N-acetyltransferase n=1 Tax=Nocardiopsis oceanisediminis TaxID=2816862 RepID=UPI003B38B6C8
MHADGETRTGTARPAGPEDVPALVELVNSAYRGEGSKEGWTTEADLLGGQRIDAEGVTALLRTPDTAVLVAEAGGRLTVCCELKRSGEGDAYFGMFSVSPAAQGKGLGGAMMTEAEGYAARVWGARRMRMLVIRQRGELIAWYERRGYARTGAVSPFPYGDERFGIPRRDDLEFIELAKELPGA